MKSRRHNVSDDGLPISRRSSRSSTSVNGREKSEPIPFDLVFELLLSLPAKTVARCRCVSKLWASTLRGPDFTELFLTRSSSRSQLLFSCRKNDDLLFFTAPQNADESSSLVSPSYHMKFRFVDGSRICGHVRGLVCVTHLRTVKGRKETVPEICNPSTGQSLTLPNLPKVETSRVNVRNFFVYDPIGKQYKVLSMTWPCYKSQWECQQHQVVTLGTGNLSWRMIECSIPHHPTCDGICIDGCLYYQAMVVNGYRIVCFDITCEKFTCIKISDCAVPWRESTLVNHKGKLATLTSDGDGELTGQSTCIELWFLVDAEKHEWSKHIHVLPPFWKELVGNASLYFTGMAGMNKIVLSPRYTSSLFYVFYYNFERGTIRRVEIEGLDALNRVQIQGMDVLRHCRFHTFLHHVENVKLYANV